MADKTTCKEDENTAEHEKQKRPEKERRQTKRIEDQSD
jgi:hypothetical protein